MNFYVDPRFEPAASQGEQAAIVSIQPDGMTELIRWLDPLKDNNEVLAALEEFQRRSHVHRHTPQPLECLEQGRRVAAAYMMLLGARVAAVAGLRAVESHTLSAAEVLNRLVTEVRSQGVIQIQAILDGTDSVANEIVQLAGFVPLAELKQLVLTLDRGRAEEVLPTDALPDARWILARELTRDELTSLFSSTFIETLDCPALDGLRSVEDVLEGFLDGQLLADQDAWWVLQHQEKQVGCVLVNHLPSGATELVYMGLRPSARGRGLGRLLLAKGIAAAQQFGSELFAAAVDCGNWPAIRLYMQAGFQEHGRVQAWFHRP